MYSSLLKMSDRCYKQLDIKLYEIKAYCRTKILKEKTLNL